jgi:enoyl-CoA hydratase
MKYSRILYQIEAGIATVTFNRPKALNALNNELLGELSHAIETIGENEDVRALILTGAGTKAFVAGADINELAKHNALEAKLFAKRGHHIISALQKLPIPVIAAVNGYALGGGTEIALACDFIYASETAVFGLPEITLGVIPGFGGTQRLPRLIGPNRAKEMIFTGKMISAAEGEKLGLVNQVCSPQNLLPEVIKTAKLIIKFGKVSLLAAKEVINNGLEVDLAMGCSMEINAFALCMASKDAKEGTAAFLEKRKPKFTGTRIS